MSLLLMVLLGAGTVSAAETPASWCYPSGFQIAVVPRDGSPLVGIAAVVDGGSSEELPTEVGAAHTLEHLWFRTPRLGYPTADDWLNDIGADANAYTTADETIFLTVAHKRVIRSMLQAEAERLGDPMAGVSDDEIATEKRVIQAEIDQRFEGRNPSLQAVLRRLVPQSHPYARLVSGTRDEVAALGRPAIQAYADRLYTPAHTSLYISGSVRPDAVQRIVEETFPPEVFASPDDPANTVGEPCDAIDDRVAGDLPDPADASSWSQVEAGVDQPVSVVAWTLPSGFAKQELAQMAGALMSWQIRKNSRLSDARCSIVPMRQLSVLLCSASTEADNGQDRWRGALNAADRLWKQSGMLFDSKFQYWASVAKAIAKEDFRKRDQALEVLSSSEGALESGAVAFHRSHGRHAASQISAEEAAAFAQQWLTEDRLRGVTLVPAAHAAAASTGFHGSRAQPTQEPADLGDVDAIRLARLIVDPGLDRISAREVSGRDVWVLEVRGLQRALMSAVYPGDSGWSDGALRQRAWDLIEDPWDLMNEDDRYTAFDRNIEVWADADDSYWAFTASGKNLDTTARILRAAVPPPIQQIPKAEDKAAFEALTTWRAEAEKNANWVADHLRWNALSAGMPHPLMDPEGFEALGRVPRKDAREFATTYLKPRRARLVAVVPQDDADRAHAAFNRAFGVAAEIDAFRPGPPQTREAQPRAITVLDAGDAGPQARVTAECHIGEGDAVDLWILERALARDLNNALRNDLGVTYGVHPTFDYTAHGVTLKVATRVPHEAAGVAIASILETLASFGSGAISGPTLDRYKLEVARGTALRWQHPEEILWLMQYASASGLQPSELGLADRLAAVDGEGLATRLKPCATREAITAVGDAEAVGTSLTAAGLPWSRWTP